MKRSLSQAVREPISSNADLLSNPFYKSIRNQEEFARGYDFELSHIQGNKTEKNSFPFKRITPFLLLEVFLVVLFAYMFLMGKVIMQSIYVTAFLFPFMIVNILLIDFALCNYFQGKKNIQNLVY